MKSFSVIKNHYRISILQEGEDGFVGQIIFPRWQGTIICSNGGGWDHVSVAPYKKHIVPSWEDMCDIKDICFHLDEAVIQIHPPKSEYVNNMENCLHLWRKNDGDMNLPPSIMVGIRNGQTMRDAKEEVAALNEGKI